MRIVHYRLFAPGHVSDFELFLEEIAELIFSLLEVVGLGGVIPGNRLPYDWGELVSLIL